MTSHEYTIEVLKNKFSNIRAYRLILNNESASVRSTLSECVIGDVDAFVES